MRILQGRVTLTLVISTTDKFNLLFVSIDDSNEGLMNVDFHCQELESDLAAKI